MMEEEQKEKYANFLDKVSEILGLNRPVDILRLCAVTDEYLKPIEKRIAELEKENAELKQLVEWLDMAIDSDIPIADKLAELEKENVELKNQVSFLKDNLRVVRKDREHLQLDVAKGLKEFVKDYPATALRYLANEKYVEHFDKAKEIIEELYNIIPASMSDYAKEPMEHARKFMMEE